MGETFKHHHLYLNLTLGGQVVLYQFIVKRINNKTYCFIEYIILYLPFSLTIILYLQRLCRSV